MSQAAQKHARNLVVMITAGGAMDEVLEMARAFGVRAVHVQQLAVPAEERVAQRHLVAALQVRNLMLAAQPEQKSSQPIQTLPVGTKDFTTLDRAALVVGASVVNDNSMRQEVSREMSAAVLDLDHA